MGRRQADELVFRVVLLPVERVQGLIGNSRCMREEVPNGHAAPDRRTFGQVPYDAVFESQLALLNQEKDPRCSELLGDRSYLVGGTVSCGYALLGVGVAVAPVKDQTVSL